MAIASIADSLEETVESLHRKLSRAIGEHRAFVQDLEENHFFPDLAQVEVPQKLSRLTKRVEELNDAIRKYAFFFPELVRFAEQVDDLVEEHTERFFQWTRRRTIDTKEAAEMFNRSRSTIYRWIYKGKLKAIKVKHRWVIAI